MAFIWATVLHVPYFPPANLEFQFHTRIAAEAPLPPWGKAVRGTKKQQLTGNAGDSRWSMSLKLASQREAPSKADLAAQLHVNKWWGPFMNIGSAADALRLSPTPG